MKLLQNIVKNGILTRFYSSFSQIDRVKYLNDTLELDVKLVNSNKPSQTYKFDSLWLRFNCHSNSSKQDGSGQRITDLAKLPINLTIKKCNFDESNIYIEWYEDDTKTFIPIDYLVDNYPDKKQNMNIDLFSTKDLKVYDYKMFFQNDQINETVVQSWMKHIYLYGFTLLKNVPVKHGQVLDVAKLVCPIQQTVYGEIFDVEAIPNPINIAYSNSKLGYHMDLIYYESAPGLQFLHCIKNDSVVKGGESILLDIFKATHDFRLAYPNYYNCLAKIPATFQKIHFQRERPVYMLYQKPHIIENHEKKIISVNWAPPFEGPLKGLSRKQIKDYYESYLVYNKFLNDHPYKIELLLKPGDIICFNNRRILHSRNSFELNGGSRHLQGCYMNIDEFKSAVMYGEYKIEKSLKNLPNIAVGNNDYSVGF